MFYHEGKELKKVLKNKGIGAKEASEMLGRKDRQSVYNFFKTERFHLYSMDLLGRSLIIYANSEIAMKKGKEYQADKELKLKKDSDNF